MYRDVETEDEAGDGAEKTKAKGKRKTVENQNKRQRGSKLQQVTKGNNGKALI